MEKVEEESSDKAVKVSLRGSGALLSILPAISEVSRSTNVDRRQLERDLEVLTGFLGNPEQLRGTCKTEEEFDTRLSKLIAKCENLQAKIEAKHEKRTELLEAVVTRAERALEACEVQMMISCLPSPTLSLFLQDETEPQWKGGSHLESERARLFSESPLDIEALIVNYLASDGMEDVARQLVEEGEPDLRRLADISLYEDERKLLQTVKEGHDLGPSLQWVGENSSKLSNRQIPVKEELILQKASTLLAQGQGLQALRFIQEEGNQKVVMDSETGLFNPKILEFLTRLVNPNNADEVFDDSSWASAAEALKSAYRRLYNLPEQPLLRNLASAGMIALHTPDCNENRTINDPACLPSWNAKNKQSRFKVERVQSVLFCSLSGEHLGPDNPAVVSPDGYPMSQSAFLRFTADDEWGAVQCPGTDNKHDAEKFKRLYLT